MFTVILLPAQNGPAGVNETVWAFADKAINKRIKAATKLLWEHQKWNSCLKLGIKAVLMGEVLSVDHAPE